MAEEILRSQDVGSPEGEKQLAMMLLAALQSGEFLDLLTDEDKWVNDLSDEQQTQSLWAYTVGAEIYVNEEWSSVWKQTLQTVHTLLFDQIEQMVDPTERFAAIDIGAASGRFIIESNKRYPKGLFLGVEPAKGLYLHALGNLRESGLRDEVIINGNIMDENTRRDIAVRANGREVRAITAFGSLPHIKKKDRKNLFEWMHGMLSSDGGVVYFSEKYSPDGNQYRDSKLGPDRIFATMSPVEMLNVLSVAQQVGFEVVLTMIEPHHEGNGKRPKWFEVFMIKPPKEV